MLITPANWIGDRQRRKPYMQIDLFWNVVYLSSAHLRHFASVQPGQWRPCSRLDTIREEAIQHRVHTQRGRRPAIPTFWRISTRSRVTSFILSKRNYTVWRHGIMWNWHVSWRHVVYSIWIGLIVIWLWLVWLDCLAISRLNDIDRIVHLVSSLQNRPPAGRLMQASIFQSPPSR